MKQLIKKALWLKHHHTAHHGYHKLYERIIKLHSEYALPVEGEDEWLAKWRQIDPKIKPTAYRIFSHYVEHDPHILPLETCLAYFEPVLNPIEYRPYYSDKNMFDRIFGSEHTLGALLRQINGVFYTPDYQPVALNNTTLNQMLEGNEAIIIKPSVDGESGRGVRKFTHDSDGIWTDSDNEALNLNYLNTHYRGNIVVQRCFRQSDYLAQFNPTSVNTLRIFVLRRPTTGECVIPSVVLRIGGKGAIVDNAHGGGRFVGVDAVGTLHHEAGDFLGNRYHEHNGIDFQTETYRIPNFYTILDFAKYMGNQVLHHHILAFDICLDNKNNPYLMEVNVHGFGGWIFQFCGQPTFGPWTDEIIEWCKHRHPRKLIMI